MIWSACEKKSQCRIFRNSSKQQYVNAHSAKDMQWVGERGKKTPSDCFQRQPLEYPGILPHSKEKNVHVEGSRGIHIYTYYDILFVYDSPLRNV